MNILDSCVDQQLAVELAEKFPSDSNQFMSSAITFEEKVYPKSWFNQLRSVDLLRKSLGSGSYRSLGLGRIFESWRSAWPALKQISWDPATSALGALVLDWDTIQFDQSILAEKWFGQIIPSRTPDMNIQSPIPFSGNFSPTIVYNFITVSQFVPVSCIISIVLLNLFSMHDPVCRFSYHNKECKVAFIL